GPEKPKRPRGIDAATVEAMAARYEQGLSYKTVGREFGRAESTVRYLLVERRGIVSRPSSVPYKHPAPEERVCAREGCDERFTPTGYQAAQPGGGRFCSRACHYAPRYVADPEDPVC